MRCSVSVIASGCTGQPGRLMSGDSPSRDEAVAEVVAQAHRARRVVAHRGNAAVGGAGAERHHDRGARREPVEPRARGDRLAVRVDAEAAPVTVAVDLLVGDRALDDEHERVELAARGRVPGAQVVVADVVGEQRVVERDARLAGDGAAQQLLETRAGRGRERDRLAVAAESARQPEHVDDQPLGLAVPREVDRLASRADGRPPAHTSSPRRALGRSASAARCSAAVPCRCSAPSRLVTSPACESRVSACETDGRSAPTSRPSRRCVSGSAMRMPPGSTRPQRPARCHSSSVSRTSRRGCEVIARWTSRSAARVQARDEQRARDLRPRLDALGERIVEQGEPRRHERVPGRLALEQVVDARGERLQHVAVADDLGRRAVADADVDAERAVDHEQARPVADLGEAAREVAVAGRRGEHRGGHDLTRDEAHAQVELGREVVVEVEQVVVRRGRERSRCSRGPARRAIARSPGLMLPVEQRWRAPGTVVGGATTLCVLRRPRGDSTPLVPRVKGR